MHCNTQETTETNCKSQLRAREIGPGGGVVEEAVCILEFSSGAPDFTTTPSSQHSLVKAHRLGRPSPTSLLLEVSFFWVLGRRKTCLQLDSRCCLYCSKITATSSISSSPWAQLRTPGTHTVGGQGKRSQKHPDALDLPLEGSLIVGDHGWFMKVCVSVVAPVWHSVFPSVRHSGDGALVVSFFFPLEMPLGVRNSRKKCTSSW